MTDAVPGSLQAPKRNKYFHGKLLDAAHMQLEQCYGIDKRRMLNRLALGSGVLCGLGVTAGVDGTLCIDPGVAIDGCGREIVVPVARAPIDPAQPTDDAGKPLGDKLTDGLVSIYLCYTQCDDELTDVYVADCDGTATKAPSITVERYRVIVRQGVPAAEPPELTPVQRDAIFPATPAEGFDRRVAAEETLAVTCGPAPECCVLLATVTLPSEDQDLAVDQYTYRAEVFSNTVLFELIAGLADRVDACCAAMHTEQTIVVVDGDAQTAHTEQALDKPVIFQVTDTGGTPAPGVVVTVATADADAGVSEDNTTFTPSVSLTTDADGKVTAFWQLGSTVGPQTVTAALASGSSASAHATATPWYTSPRVQYLEPKNTAAVAHDWADNPTIAVTFDQEMDVTGLRNPEPWLRVWSFPINQDDHLEQGSRMDLGADLVGMVTVYRGKPTDVGRFVVLVVMSNRSADTVVSLSGIPLDTKYGGTALDDGQLNKLWDSDTFTPDAAFSGAVRDGGGTLPSGQPGGGYFHAFFTVQPAP